MRGIAYLLAFLSGAAAMFAYQHLPLQSDVVQQDQSIALEPTTGNHAPPARIEPTTDETRIADSESSAVESEESTKTGTESPKELPPQEVVVALDATQSLFVSGITEPAYGRYAKLPLATNQAIAFVDVKPGDRVKKGYQVFSHWESPERLQAVKTELEKTKKIFSVAQTRAAAAKQTVERLRKLEGNVAAQQLQDAETASTVRQGELEAAELAVAESESRFNALEFEFNQAFVTSPIEGVVASVDVITGERRQPGAGFRGVTIIDTRVLHCRCMVDQHQIALLERLASQSVTQTAAAESATASDGNSSPGQDLFHQRLQTTVESDGVERPAKILSVGLQAEAKSGLFPIILEIQNPNESLRCGISVNVCFRAL